LTSEIIRGAESSPLGLSSLKRREPAHARALRRGSSHEKPLKLEGVHARLAGAGGMIIVRYRTSMPLPGSGKSVAAHVLDQASGKRIDVLRIPIIGLLNSHPLTRMPTCEGYFVADNVDRKVVPGSKITVVVGDLKVEDVAVSD
jgi:hypothetical protein